MHRKEAQWQLLGGPEPLEQTRPAIHCQQEAARKSCPWPPADSRASAPGSGQRDRPQPPVLPLGTVPEPQQPLDTRPELPSIWLAAWAPWGWRCGAGVAHAGRAGSLCRDTGRARSPRSLLIPVVRHQDHCPSGQRDALLSPLNAPHDAPLLPHGQRPDKTRQAETSCRESDLLKQDVENYAFAREGQPITERQGASTQNSSYT